MSNPSITADKTPWYQWDTGLTVTVSGGEMNECHFANRKQGTAYVQAVINGVARVPDELLQVAAPIKAYGFVCDASGCQTYVDQSFDVIARNIPSDYAYTKTIQKTIRDAEVARDEAVQAAKDAKASELSADDSAVEASNSAQSAGESASAAATSASNAAKSAGDAAKSASDAKAAADKAVEDASVLLKTYTDNAKTSADNAATSASNAADSASAASGSASAASQSATDASNAKVAAQTAKAGAETAAGNAATSASNAESSATAAAKSASDAAASVNAINVIAPKTVNVPAVSSDQFDIAIGQNANTTANQSIAIGVTSTASHLASIALGSFSETSKDYELSLGRLLENGADSTREITHVSEPTEHNSASTKKYTDDNDAKTLTEAKKYTDANTSNALVGTVSGKLLHVEDAWSSKPLGLTIDGAYKQEGTPSPENPVPIVVVENPVLMVTGKNQFDGEISKGGGNSVNAIYLSKGTYTFSLLSNVDWWSNASNHETVYIHNAADNVYLASAKFINPAVGKRSEATFTLNEDAQIKVYSYGAWSNDAVSDLQIEKGTVATDYAPYTSASLPITLPAEHPYLASLPDGTRDELVVKDGRKVLRRKTQMFTIQSIASAIFDLTDAPNAFFFSAVDITANVDVKNHGVGGYGSTASVLCNKMINGYSPEQIASNKASGAYAIAIGEDRVFYCNTIGITTSDEAISWFAENTPTILIPMETPVDIDLGKLDIPSLPDTISNVWVDANLTPEMSMTYKRDINIAFDNLAQAVVAAAAGE